MQFSIQRDHLERYERFTVGLTGLARDFCTQSISIWNVSPVICKEEQRYKLLMNGAQEFGTVLLTFHP